MEKVKAIYFTEQCTDALLSMIYKQALVVYDYLGPLHDAKSPFFDIGQELS